MKLKSLQIFPNGKDGWFTDIMRFGDNITQLYGPTSCGKTPVIQSIAFCLGYPCIFREDIYHRCNHAVLIVEVKNQNYEIRRTYLKGKDVDIQVTEPSGMIQEFYNEGDFSLYLFELLNIDSKDLLDNYGKKTQPYLSTILPVYYIDQEEGYSDYYSPPSKFIKDQFSEMVRLIFSLPAKNSFNEGQAKRDAKEKLEFLDRQVEEYSRQVDIAKEGASNVDLAEKEIEKQIASLKSELEVILDSGANYNDAMNALDTLISNIRKRISGLVEEIESLDNKIFSFDQIIQEINTEIDTLNLNEAARRVFLSFNEICSSNDCKLFSASSESYSKNLLYLKDQIKDLVRNQESDKIRIEQLKQRRDEEIEYLHNTIKDRKVSEDSSEIELLLHTVSNIKDEIFELEDKKRKLIEYGLSQQKYSEIFNKRDKALKEHESFSIDRKSNPDLIKIRTGLRQKFLDWLDILNTQNVVREITFTNDFGPVLGAETIKQLRGSTKVRAILSFHAALIELANTKSKCLLNIFILDAPKQHELPNVELDNFLKELKKLSGTQNTQIIFSATEYKYSGDERDEVWVPLYPGKKQKMFMNNRAQ